MSWEEYKYTEVHLETKDGIQTKWQRIPQEELRKWVDDNPNAASYYSTVQSFSLPAKAEGEEHWSPLFIDLDDDATGGKASLRDTRLVVDYFLKGFEAEPQVWFSGNKGFHIIVPGVVFGAEPHPLLTYIWHHLAKYITEKLGIKSTREGGTFDERVYSIPRMWRIEGTRHSKTNLFKRRMVLHELGLSIEKIRELAVEYAPCPEEILYEREENLARLFRQAEAEFKDRQEYIASTAQPLDFQGVIPACIKYLFEHGLAELGTKNRADMVVAGFLKDSGVGIKQAGQTIEAWAERIPIEVTHIHNPRARAHQSVSVLRTVYGDPKYHFSCGSAKNCGLPEELCKGCVIKAGAKKVELANFARADNMGLRIEIEADAIGADNKELLVPESIRGVCGFDPDSAQCTNCLMSEYFNAEKMRTERTIEFNSRNPLTLELVDVSNVYLAHRIKRIFSVESRCRLFNYQVSWGNAQVLYLASRVSSEFRVEDKVTRVRALALKHGLDLNRGYGFKGYVWSHPRSLAATFVIDEAEPLQSTLATFTVPEDIKKKFTIFQPSAGQTALEKAKEIHRAFTNNFLFVFGRQDLILAADMPYHSVRWINFQKQQIKGWLDILIVGDTGQAKTEVTRKLMEYYGLGTMAAGETTSRTGLLYSIQIVKGEPAWVAFGLLPRASGHLVVVDEIHGMPYEDFREFTLVRSSGVVDVKRVAWGTAPAETRLISIANANPGKSLATYGHPVEAIIDIPCFKALEDVRRFDYAVGVRTGDVGVASINRDVYELEQIDNPYDPEICKNLILWVWTRTPDQVLVSRDTEKRILELAKVISDEYVPDIPLVEAADIRHKILRLATAFAGRTYSSEDGEHLLVLPEHADAAYDMLHELYSSPGLEYYKYSLDKARLEISPAARSTLMEEFKTVFPDSWHMLGRWLLQTNDFNKVLLTTTTGVPSQEAATLLGWMLTNRFLAESRAGRFRKTASGREFLMELLPQPEFEHRKAEEIEGAEVEKGDDF